MSMTDVKTAKPAPALLVGENHPVTLMLLVRRAKWPLLWGTVMGALLISIPLWLLGAPSAWTGQMQWFVGMCLLAVLYFMAYWHRVALQNEAEDVWAEFVKEHTPPQLKGRPEANPIYALKKGAQEVYTKMSDSVTKGTLDRFAVALEDIEDGWKGLADREEALFEEHSVNSWVPPAWRKVGCKAVERTRMQMLFVSRANKAGADLFQLREEMGRYQVYQDELLGQMAVATQ